MRTNGTIWTGTGHYINLSRLRSSYAVTVNVFTFVQNFLFKIAANQFADVSFLNVTLQINLPRECFITTVTGKLMYSESNIEHWLPLDYAMINNLLYRTHFICCCNFDCLFLNAPQMLHWNFLMCWIPLNEWIWLVQNSINNIRITYRVLNVRVQLPSQSKPFITLRTKEILTFVMRLHHMRSESFSRIEILQALLARKRTVWIDLQIFAIINESAWLIRLIGFNFCVRQHMSFQ